MLSIDSIEDILIYRMASFFILLSIFFSTAFAEDCPPGQQWDATLNQCHSIENASDISTATQACNGNKDCYKQNAENALKQAEQDGKVKAELANSSGLLNKSMSAAAVAVPMAMGMAMLKNAAKRGGTKCAAPSIYAMFGGGVAMVAGDLLSNMQHKSRLKKIDEDWKKVQGSETQSQAFEFLARREDSMNKAASMKTKFFGVATMAFGAAAVMSTLEVIRLDQHNVVCKVDEAAEDKAQADRVAAEDAALKAEDDAEAVANAAKSLEGGTGTLGPTSFMGPIDRWESLIEGNLTQLKIQNVLEAPDLATFVTLTDEFSSQKSQTIEQFNVTKSFFDGSGLEKDLVLLRELKNNFRLMLFHLSPFPNAHAQDGPDIVVTGVLKKKIKGLSKFLLMPATRAVISGVFTAWAGVMTLHSAKQAKVSNNRAIFLRKMKDEFNVKQGAIAPGTSTNSGSISASGNSAIAASTTIGNGVTTNDLENDKSCISNSGDADSNCACKKTNSCLSSGLSGAVGLSPTALSVVSSGLTPVDQLGSGNLAAGSVTAAGATSNAIRLLQTARKVATSSPKSAELLKNSQSLASQIADAFMNAASGVTSPSMASSSPMPLSPSAAKEMLEKELTSQFTPISAGASDTPAFEGAADNSALNAAIATENQVSEVLKRDMDYGQNDVHTDSKSNIFEVLSNRYQKSVIKKLLDPQ